MKKSLLILFLLIMFSIPIVAENKSEIAESAQAIAALQNDFPNIFRPIGKFFKRIVGIKPESIYCPPPAYVKNLSLNKTEIVRNCSTKHFCSKTSQTIEVTSEGFDSENDVLIYLYHITAGKILGDGAKVVWDLSNVEPGIYTITAGVDDGCGVCGQTITQEIKVLECADCKNP